MTKTRDLPQTWPIYTLRNGHLHDDEGKRRVHADMPVPYFKSMDAANAWLEAQDIPGTVKSLRLLNRIRAHHQLKPGATIVGRYNQIGLIEYATGKVVL